MPEVLKVWSYSGTALLGFTLMIMLPPGVMCYSNGVAGVEGGDPAIVEEKSTGGGGGDKADDTSAAGGKREVPEGGGSYGAVSSG